MTTAQTTRTSTIARIIAGLFDAYFVYFTVNGLISLVSIWIGGKPLVVGIVYASEIVASAIASIICILFMLRGYIPAVRQQAGKGCVFQLLASFAAFFIAALLAAILQLGSVPALTLKISMFSLCGALGGVLGLYLARPSAATPTSERSSVEDDRELGESADQAKNSH